MKNDIIKNKPGFTLIHLIMILVAMGMAAAAAMRYSTITIEKKRVVKTQKEMDKILKAIYGNPEIVPQTNFGYVGDMGTLPTSISQLYTNQGGNWSGPYILLSFNEDANEYLNDEWGTAYSFVTAGGVRKIISSGGVDSLSLDFFVAPNRLTQNTIKGKVKDWYSKSPNWLDRLTNFRFTLYRKGNKYNLTSQVGSQITNLQSDGSFTITNVAAGNYELSCDYLADGVSAHSIMLTIQPIGATTNINIRFNSTFPD